MVVDMLSDREVDRLFHALADATRRDIVRRVMREDCSISQLAQSYSMSMTAVQKHVIVLEGAGLIAKIRQGREQRIVGNPDAVKSAQGLLDSYEQIWRDRFKRMDELLAESITGGKK
ncbi:MAG: helix-turn-helix domain-containing protein [Actinomycetota bacterium]|nr:helix-turn-helix domain-containing protein [Actinomycetota bacterium]